MGAITKYFSDLSEAVGRGWTRFWFTPSDAFPLALLRVFVGLAGCYFLLSHNADLLRWFGPHGLLPVENLQDIERAFDASQATPPLRLSYLNGMTAPAGLWTVHVLGMVVVLAFTVGFYTRLSAILSLAVLLSYIHRAPLITGQFEPILTMMLFYLCMGPAGAYLSVDRWLKSRSQAQQPAARDRQRTSSVSATVALRLLQVHVSAFYLFMGLSKLAGEPWWDGSAVWWLIAHSESRLVDLTFLHNFAFFVYFWTHMVVIFELSFSMLIWNRWARPVLVAMAVPMWLSLALITGLVSFCLIMLVANLVFVPASTLRHWCQECLAAVGLKIHQEDEATSSPTSTRPIEVLPR